MKYIAIACLVIFTAFACHALWDMDKFVRELPATSSKLNATLADLDAAIGVFHDAEQKQAAYYDPARPGGLPQQVQRTVVDLKRLIGRTDTSLNGGTSGSGQTGVLSEVSRTLVSTQQLSQNAATSLNDTSAKLQPILADLGTGAAAFAKQTPEILANIHDTSAQTVIIAQNTADGTHEVDLTLHDVQAFTHRELAPVKGTWNVIKAFLMEFAGPAAQVATAIK